MPRTPLKAASSPTRAALTSSAQLPSAKVLEAAQPPENGFQAVSAIIAAAPIELSIRDTLRSDPKAIIFDVELQKRFRALAPDVQSGIRDDVLASGVSAAVLDAALTDDGRKSSSAASVLADICQGLEPFHTAERDAYVDADVNGNRMTYPVPSRDVRDYLIGSYLDRVGKPPSRDALQGSIDSLAAIATFRGSERSVFRRVADHEGAIFIDLHDGQGRALEITKRGWSITHNPPTRFIRSPGSLYLPEPKRGGSIETLWDYVNVRSQSDRVLLVSTMLASMRQSRSYPAVVLTGEQGSAKTTSSRMIRSLIDPHHVPDRSLPRDEKELITAVRNSHLLCFDNCSGVPASISDALCRTATGGGYSPRQLFSDDIERPFHGAKPLILNGIDDLATRPDLADRCITITLDPIPEERRCPESELWERFEEQRPYILGALLDGLVEGLRNLPEIKLERLPRMADFAKWATACETAYWPTGTFMAAYDANRGDTIDAVIEGDAVASAIRRFMATRSTWTGTATELLAELADCAGETAVRSRSWPGDQKALGNRLRRVATVLRTQGIEIGHDRRGKERTRLISITRDIQQPADRVDHDGRPEAGAAVHRLHADAARETRERQMKTRQSVNEVMARKASARQAAE